MTLLAFLESVWNILLKKTHWRFDYDVSTKHGLRNKDSEISNSKMLMLEITIVHKSQYEIMFHAKRETE